MWRSERDQFPPSNQIAIKPQGYFDRIMFWNAETAGLFFVRQAASNAQPRFGIYRDWRAETQTIYFDKIMFWNEDPSGHPDWQVNPPPG